MNQATIEKLAPLESPAVQTPLTPEARSELMRVAEKGTGYCIGAQGGPEGNAFEQAFVEKMGCADAVAVNSCSSALEMAAMLSGLDAADEVIIPAHTFVATAVPMGRTGATIKWADIDPDTRVISAKSIESLITPKTKVIVVVHLYGMPAEMDDIVNLARKHEITVIEDCAQAPGARYKGKRVGTFGDFGCFSFHGAKNITTLGEGGMLAVRDAGLGDQARRMRWMGNWPFEESRENDWVPAGNDLIEPVPGLWPVNFSLAEGLAAVGKVMIKQLDQINDSRRRQATRFIGALADYPELSFQKVPDHCEHAYHLMPGRYDGEAFGRHRDDLMQLIRDKYRVKCIVQYWPLYRSPLFRSFGFGEANVPETDRYFDNMISFPWWSGMGDHLLDDMAERTRGALDEMRKG
jgi:perosamine synthetase